MKWLNLANQSPVGLAVLCAASISVYLLASNFIYQLGYPLDDAWIHQTYARNLASGEGWSFSEGLSSGGSTSPLWSALLAPGYFLRVPPFAWTHLLGWLTLWGIACVGTKAFDILQSTGRILLFWAGALLALEWHLVWAATSGMETSLFALVVLFVITWLIGGWKYWTALGALVGLSIWIRPDGITLLGPALWVLYCGKKGYKDRIQALFELTCGFLLLFFPYLIFNRISAGAWWPNTFYAKQAEYASELFDPLVIRLYEQALLPLVGVGMILLPGFIYLLWQQLKKRQWALLAAPLWMLGFVTLYAIRLPVTYQHGRYIIPIMPIYFLWGFAGTAQWVQTTSPVFWRRVVSKVMQISLALTLLLFWLLGARAFGRDVAVIQSEMVQTARWIAHKTEPQALIAAHDIGALGYFGDRRILDLAGLVSPEVIPFIRNEQEIANYMDLRGANYLMSFPGWYPQLVRRGEMIYTTDSRFSPEQGGENMAVFHWLTKP